MTAAVFGFLSDAKEALAEFANNLLLVAGGFLVGYLLGGLIGWALGKWVFRQKEPETLRRLGRPVGGVLLALIVALIVFTGKGKPHGEGGDSKGTPSTETDGKNAPSKTDPDVKLDPKVTPPKIDTRPADVTIRVTILGGTDVVNERFYLIDDDRSPKTFEDLKTAITAIKAKEKGKVTVAILFPTKNRLPRVHIAVTQVENWVNEEAGLDVVFPTSKP
jgi:hypothetical protein